MSKREKITTCYVNARELVKRGRAKEARAYVLEILNMGLEEYKRATTIVEKARQKAFLEKWVEVSRQLYDKGVTPFVMNCFGLVNAKGGIVRAPRAGEAVKPAENRKEQPAVPAGGIDMGGLIAEVDSSDSQGWCADLFEANKKAVVQIHTECGAGTGFIISANGYLLTNDHVIYNGQSGFCSHVSMVFADDKRRYKVKVLFSDKRRDVALCSFEPEEVKDFACVRPIPNYADLKQGADCLVIGNAFDYGLAPFSGTVRFTRNDDGDLVYTAPSNPGDSGGPVFNRRGECIGIGKSRTVRVGGEEASAYSNATPMDTIEALLKKWTSANDITL